MFRFLILLLIIPAILIAQNGYPKPQATPNLLFYIQHSSNHNTFVYEWNANQTDPIDVYKINYEKKGVKEELTKIQKQFAYGVKYKNTAKTQFTLAAFSKHTLYLNTLNNKSWVEVILNNKKIIIDHIFIQLTSKTNGINAKADYILIYGKNHQNKSVIEKIEL